NADIKKVDSLMDEAYEKHVAGDFKGAIDAYKAALSMAPDQAAFWGQLAAAQQSAGEYRDARESYRRGYELDPEKQLSNLYYIGTLEEHFSNGTAAKFLYEKYIQLAPTGNLIGHAQDRIERLVANISNTRKLMTGSDAKKLEEAEDPLYKNAVDL